jgi:hypothetical protein
VSPDLPSRVIVGANGAYWRDFGDYLSMPPVSEDNDAIEPIAVYVREAAEPRDSSPPPDALREFVEHRVGLYLLAAEKVGMTREGAMAVIEDRDPYLARAIQALAAPPRDSSPPLPPVLTHEQAANQHGLRGVILDVLAHHERNADKANRLVTAIARWRQGFRDCGCWKTDDGFALCEWHEELFRPQREEAERAFDAGQKQGYLTAQAEGQAKVRALQGSLHRAIQRASSSEGEPHG